MDWVGGFEIKTGKSDVPRTDRGPVVAVGYGLVYLVYAGKHGETLWWSSCNGNNGSFREWFGNEQVKPSHGEAPATRDRPALAFYPNWPALVYVDHKSGKLMEMAHVQSSWLAFGEVTGFQGAQGPWSQPILASAGLCLFLLAIGPGKIPWTSYKVFNVDPSQPNYGGVSPWTAAKALMRNAQELREQTNVQCWCFAQRDRSLYLLGLAEDAIFVYSQPLPTTANNSADWAYVGKIALAEKINPLASSVIAPSTTGLFHRLDGSNHLSLAYLDLGNPLSIGASAPVTSATGKFTTNQPAGAAYYESPGQLTPPCFCVAYKGASNDDIYFANGS